MKGQTNAKCSILTSDETIGILIEGVLEPTIKIEYDNVVNTYKGNYLEIKIPEGKYYIITFEDVDNYITPASISYTAIAYNVRVLKVKYIYNPVYDLSMHDIYGNSIKLSTANCYVVKEAGTYKLPLVFGNALKDETVNSAAYTKNSGSNSHDFVDFNGTVVTSPYIETVSGTAASAQLSIADTDGIFTDISIVDGSPCRYLQFKITSVPDTGANGVLSIKNSSGVIMWSWHIWVWSYDLSTVEITNSTGVKYNILPVNLATKLDTADSINKTTGWKNWFYQWGRPTPMICPSAYNSTLQHEIFGAITYSLANAASSLKFGIQNPTTFYKAESTNQTWFVANTEKTYNLWDAACTSTGNSDNNVVKTIYDPCPIGFKIPNGNTFTGFSKSNALAEYPNGWVFRRYSGDANGTFVAASGYIDSSGSTLYVGSNGGGWLSSSASVKAAHHLYVAGGLVAPNLASYRALAIGVRPVRE